MNYPTISDTIGNTPLVRLQRIDAARNAVRGNLILGKLEGNNPAGSVKDRPALNMIEQAQARGDIKPGDTLIEATSGNTGIALAMAAAIKGYKMVLVMPDDLSVERRAAMAAYGAQVVLTPAAQGGMERARDLAQEMQAAGQGIILDQFANPDNPAAHSQGTAPEIWQQTQGRVTFRLRHGNHGNHHWRWHLSKTTKCRRAYHWGATRRGQPYSGYPQMARGIFAHYLSAQCGG
jgi:S-sulfo-L-cysteine synthase (O-acetyl-L-serine-dependent)